MTTPTQIDIATEVATLRTEVALSKAEASSRRELINAKFKATAKALEVALLASDKRLDVMNEVRQTNTDLVQRMMTRDEVQAELSSIRTKLEVIDKPNYVLWTSLITAAAIAVGGLWTVTGLKIDNAISPLAVTQEQFRASTLALQRDILTSQTHMHDIDASLLTDAARDSASIVDRAQLNDRFRDLQVDVARRKDTNQAAFNEIGTAVTRLNVWADFLHQKIFPETPLPPTKQP